MVGVIKTELVYDMYSSDSNVNRGKTTGINSEYIDLDKYNFIDVVLQIFPTNSVNTGGWSGVMRMDLTTKKKSEEWYVATNSFAYSNMDANGAVGSSSFQCVLLYNKNTHLLQLRMTYEGQTYQNTDSIISKIYGGIIC